MRWCLFFIFLAIGLPTLFFAQGKVKGTVYTDSATLKIVNIYPDSFPAVSVVFTAETYKGEPVWQLTKEKMRVKENEQSCKVISLQLVSKNKPVNLGVVIDHSGSMLNDSAAYERFYQFNIPYRSPLDNAKTAIKKFISGFDSTKDLVSVTGFSTTVSEKLPLTKNTAQVNLLVDSLIGDGGTALYDAMVSSLEEIKKGYGLKVMIVLTDGDNNNSQETLESVIAKTKRENIPVYVVGLGDVNKNVLQKIADETSGEFYFTQSASTLDDIYQSIRKKIQAFYDLVYESPNFSASDTAREIELSFDVANIYLTTNPSSVKLPEVVTAYLQKKEKEKQYLVYGGIAFIILIAAGVLLYKGKILMPSLKIVSLYPNPGNGNITIKCAGKVKELDVFDMNGILIKKYAINDGSTKLDLSGLKPGAYIAVIRNAQRSASQKFIIQ